jgi:hypothetical protein
MLTLIQKFREASFQTKFFVLNWIVYTIAIIVTTIYAYARLDFVRSYDVSKKIENNKTL